MDSALPRLDAPYTPPATNCRSPRLISPTPGEVPLVTPLGELKWINRNVCHSEDERRPAANGSAVMRQVWALLEWGGECENRETHTLREGDTPAEGMQMEFRRKKTELNAHAEFRRGRGTRWPQVFDSPTGPPGVFIEESAFRRVGVSPAFQAGRTCGFWNSGSDKCSLVSKPPEAEGQASGTGNWMLSGPSCLLLSGPRSQSCAASSA